MNMNAILQTLLEEFQEKMSSFRVLTPRSFTFPNVKNKIFVAVGMRRTGKSWFLAQTVKKLLIQGIAISQILYLNFEDDRLQPLTQEKLRQLLDGFYSLYPENHDRLCYLFLDEIQNVDDWALVIRRYYDTKKVQIYLSGSSAKLLSKEIATSLRGRSITTEVWPFSFHEYLRAQNVSEAKPPFGKKTLNNNVSAPFAVHKFYNDIKSQGIKVGKDTIYQYLEYIEDAFLVFTVPL